MIQIVTTNTSTQEATTYTVEPFTTMRTRVIPYQGEAFDVDTETCIVGSSIGTLVCKHKSGTVYYRNEQLNIEAPLLSLSCKRIIK